MNRPDISVKRLLLAAVTSTLLATVLYLAIALVTTPAPAAAQPPRPTLTPTSLPPAPTAPVVTPIPSAAGPCESICGRVVNLASGTGEAGLVVRFSGDGWSVETTSDSGGDYAYGRLGSDAGVLSLVIPAGSDLRASAGEVAIAPVPGQPIVVNLGVYGGAWTAPPLVPTVRAEPSWVRPGGQVTFTVQVANSLSTRISGMLITDLLPDGLSLIGVVSDRGSTARAGNYGAVFVGDLDPGSSVTVQFIADVLPETAAGTLRNQVSLIYRERAVGQAAASMTVGGAPYPTATSAGSEPTASPVPPEADTTPLGPTSTPALLPVTGYGLTAIGAGLGLAATALLAHRLRKSRRRNTNDSSERTE